jgi:hypothetical protein
MRTNDEYRMANTQRVPSHHDCLGSRAAPVRRSSFGRIIAVVLLAHAHAAAACDFCMAPLAGFGKGLREADGVAQARVVGRQLLFTDQDAARVAVTFEITGVLRGVSPAVGKTYRTTVQWRGGAAARRAVVMFDRGEDGPVFLDALPDDDGRLADYFTRAFAVAGKPGPDRAAFFAGFLEHADGEIAEDAYRQFAEISFEAVRAAKPSLNAGRLRAWLASEKVPAARKGLYGLLLGVAGNAQDASVFAAALPKVADTTAAAAGVLAGWCLAGGRWEAVLGEVVADRARAATCRRGALPAVRFLWTQADEAGKGALRSVLRTALGDSELAPFAVDELARLQEDWTTAQVRRLWLDKSRRSPALKPAVLNFARSLPEPARAGLYTLVDENP